MMATTAANIATSNAQLRFPHIPAALSMCSENHLTIQYYSAANTYNSHVYICSLSITVRIWVLKPFQETRDHLCTPHFSF
ncbi:hypothetical protein XENTR_v10014645 [Xenopus tropicalis]|nr:hypothetical protein XENTR_v10014645 [Xenopus tropicalis]